MITSNSTIANANSCEKCSRASVPSNLITKTLQVGSNASAKFNHFRRTSPAPSTDIATIANPFDKRPDIHFGCFKEFQKPRHRVGRFLTQVFVADHVIAVLEIVLGKLQRPLVAGAPPLQCRRLKIPPPI